MPPDATATAPDTPAAPTALAIRSRPKLLASLHDVSPLTLAASRDAVSLLLDAGLPANALTVLAVPYHEGKVRLDEHPETVDFLRELAGRGATLVAHGYTHRMAGRAPRSPIGWLKARWFARGEGELINCDADETRRRLTEARAILTRAGLGDALAGFVPPAWLLSRAAADEVVRHAGFAFVERFRGVLVGDRLRARRLIGWGSLTAIEALATSAWAWVQARRAPTDTRLAVHPPDVQRARTRRSLERTTRRLLARLEPVSYRAYVDALA